MKAGWHTKTIGEVCEVVNGGTPKTGVKEYWDGSFRWITPAEMGKRQDPYVSKTERTITELGMGNSSAKLLPNKSVILSSRAPIGHLVINTEPMAFNQGCKGLIPSEGLYYKFLFHYLTSKVDLLNSLGTGATFKELSGGKLKEVSIPIPPLPEQQRIVSVLDETFEGISTATANAEKNLSNARELFDSYLMAVFTTKAEGWIERRLSDVCPEITVGHVGSMANEYKPRGIPFLRSQNIRPFEVSMENLVYIDETFHKALKKSRLKAGDLAIVRTGYPGTAAVIPPELGEVNCSDLVIVKLGNEVNPHYLSAFFNSSFGKQLVSGKLVGAAQKHFNVTAAKQVSIALPPIPEQGAIVNHIHAFRYQVNQLEAIYQQKLSALSELKKSILHQAFTGQLH